MQLYAIYGTLFVSKLDVNNASPRYSVGDGLSNTAYKSLISNTRGLNAAL
jgi:hypothetical protein